MRVLYVDLCPSPGGSNISLLHLVGHLDRGQVQPLVALAAVNPFTRFEEAGIPVVRVHTPRWERQPAGLTAPVPHGEAHAKAHRPPSAARWLPVDRGRTNKLAAAMRSRPGSARLWHAAGGARRLARDEMPVALALRRIMRSFRPHLVHLNDVLPLNWPAAMASRSACLPVVCHCRSFDTGTPAERRWLLPGVDGMIFISQAIAQVHLAATPLLRHYAVIPNAVDLDDYAGPVDWKAVRASLGVPAEAPLLVMAGRISPWKGQHIFVAALARVRETHPAVHGVIVGLAEEADGPGYASRVQAQAEALGLAQHLHVAGFRSDMPQVLAAADVVVHCSVKPEPFGRVIIEGMAAGRPVVASALGGAAEIIADGVDGLLTPAGDPDRLAAALQRLLADAGERERLGQAARCAVAQRYQVGAHVRAVQTFYERVQAARRED
jgi:glycosyltransferase involved in cell wall biosynthesis